MENPMKEAIKTILPMVLVVFISSILLSLTYAYTSPIIKDQERLKTESILKEIFPEMGSYEKTDTGYKIFSENGSVGNAFISKRYGYSSEIKLLVGVSNEGMIKGVRVIFQEETPGLGSRIAEPEFYMQFSGKQKEDINLKKYGGEIDAVTSATISSGAFVEAVRNAGK